MKNTKKAFASGKGSAQYAENQRRRIDRLWSIYDAKQERPSFFNDMSRYFSTIKRTLSNASKNLETTKKSMTSNSVTFSKKAMSSSPTRPLRVLVAGEANGHITEAFRKLGHEAFSSDLLPTTGGHPEWHIQGDVRDILHHPWDLVIAHPPCQDLSNSGAKHWAAKRADGRQRNSINFFLHFTDQKPYLDHVPHVAIENPTGIMSTIYKKPTQWIEPHQFGHAATKKTGLWLKGLPKLTPTNQLSESEWKTYHTFPSGKRMQTWQYEQSLLPKSKRSAARARTFQGIADAMAKQWSSHIINQRIKDGS